MDLWIASSGKWYIIVSLFQRAWLGLRDENHLHTIKVKSGIAFHSIYVAIVFFRNRHVNSQGNKAISKKDILFTFTGKQLLPHDFRRCISSRTYRRECSQSLHLLVHPFRYFHLFIWIFLFLARFRRRNHCFEIVQFFGLLDLLLLSNYLKSTGFIIATWVVVIHKDWLISKPNIFSRN